LYLFAREKASRRRKDMAMNFFIRSDKSIRRAFNMMEGKVGNKWFYDNSLDSWENPKGTIPGAKQCIDELKRNDQLKNIPPNLSVFIIEGALASYAVYPNGDVKVIVAPNDTFDLAKLARKAGFEVIIATEHKSIHDEEEQN
jgi:hypothetical protein